MEPQTPIAFKEWAVVCAALAQGRQTIILRKGGIHEGRDGFRVAHREFWLLPTYLHQTAENLVPDARPTLDRLLRQAPGGDQFRIEHYAVVHDVFEVQELASLDRIADSHVLSPDTVRQRFEYREPGLFVLSVRVYASATPFDLASTPYIAGCRSWVELPQPLPTNDLQAVLSESEFSRRQSEVRLALAKSAKTP